MTGDNAPLDQAPELDFEEPCYLEIPAELDRILASHKEWLDTRGKKGARAQLDRYDFAYLNLTGVTLRDSELSGALFAKANLLKANLRDAVLTDADLSGATNLAANQLGGADLTGAKLPETLGKFEDLGNIAEASKNASPTFLGMLAACVYSWLAIATTTDAALLTNTASTNLPIIQTAIPVVGFYIAAPFLLLAIYIYLHINLQRLWEGLANLPAIFPDGRRLDQAIYPWFLNGLVCAYLPRLQRRRPPFSRVQVVLSLFLTWILLPLTIMLIWLRYLTRQDWPVTLELIILQAITWGFALHSFIVARRILKGSDSQGKEGIKAPIPCIVASFLLSLVLLLFSFGSMYGIGSDPWLPLGQIPDKNEFYSIAITASGKRPEPEKNQIIIKLPGFSWLFPSQIRLERLRHFVPTLFFWRSTGPFAYLEGQDVSARTTSRNGKDFGQVKGALLHGRSLRYAYAMNAFLVNADLREAQLQQANLSYANLTNAKLWFADLLGAKLERAQLVMADFWGANLTEAILIDAQLEGASIEGAHLEGAKGLTADKLRKTSKWPLAFYDKEVIAKLKLQENHNVRLKEKNLSGYWLENVDFSQADFRNFDLSRCNLRGANLFGVSLNEANLQGAHLEGAKELNKDVILAASNWPLAFYDDTFINALQLLPKNHNKRLAKKDLKGYHLNGANLRGADLHGFDLRDTHLEGANLSEVKNLTQEQVNSAKTNEQTILPKGLKLPCK